MRLFASLRGEFVICSVVVPTYNRAGMLQSVVSALLEQRNCPEYEVIIVDNNSTDATATVAAALCSASRGRMKYVLEQTIGSSAARNCGIAAARGDIVAFLDDDAIPRVEWLASILNTYANYPDAWCVGGKILLRLPDERPAWFNAHSMRVTSLLGLFDRGDGVHRLAYPLDVWGGNLSVRKDVLRRIGGFDVSLGLAGRRPLYGEETELCWRIQREGGGVYYCGGAVVDHVVAPAKLTKRYLRSRAYWSGRTQTILQPTTMRQRLRDLRGAANCALKSWAKGKLFPSRAAAWRVFNDELSAWGWFGQVVQPTARDRRGTGSIELPEMVRK